MQWFAFMCVAAMTWVERAHCCLTRRFVYTAACRPHPTGPTCWRGPSSSPRWVPWVFRSSVWLSAKSQRSISIPTRISRLLQMAAEGRCNGYLVVTICSSGKYFTWNMGQVNVPLYVCVGWSLKICWRKWRSLPDDKQWYLSWYLS